MYVNRRWLLYIMQRRDVDITRHFFYIFYLAACSIEVCLDIFLFQKLRQASIWITDMDIYFWFHLLNFTDYTLRSMSSNTGVVIFTMYVLHIVWTTGHALGVWKGCFEFLERGSWPYISSSLAALLSCLHPLACLCMIPERKWLLSLTANLVLQPSVVAIYSVEQVHCCCCLWNLQGAAAHELVSSAEA